MVTPINNSVVKAFAILDIFNDHRETVTTNDVVSLLGLNTITAHRFLKTLVQVGALASPHKGIYQLGFKLVDYGERAGSFRRMGAVLQPFLNKLAAETNEGALATTFDGTAVTCIATAHPDHAFVFNARVGARHEPYATANGKLWLAHIGQDRLESYLASNELVPISKNTLTNKDALFEELALIREQGYATNRSEREAGLHAVAAPIFSRTGEMVTGISVFAPAERMSREKEEEIFKVLTRTLEKAQATLYGNA